MIKNINTAASTGSFPDRLTVIGDSLYFTANDGVVGKELWVTDGKVARLVKDLTPGLKGSVFASDFIPLKDTFYFSADEGIGQEKLWVSDGTLSGTQPLANSNAVVVRSLMASNARIYFIANNSASGRELWSSDGITTAMVKDIVAGPQSANIQQMVIANNQLLFQADDGVHGAEPWISDGSLEGTQLLADLSPDATGSRPQFLLNISPKF